MIILDYTHIQISGADAAKLLQGQLTCDINKITQKNGLFGAHCNPQGRILYLFYLSQINDHYYVTLPKNMLEIAFNALKKYAVFFKVTLSKVDDWVTMGYQQSDELIPIHFSSKITLPSKTGRFIALFAKEEINKIKLSLNCPKTWQLDNIKDCIPMIYPETSGKLLPHDLNLPELGAVDFKKGCYTGQEIIARMHYRGKLKNHLYHAQIISMLPILPGSLIYTEDHHQKKEIGIVLESRERENAQHDVLIVTDAAHAKDQLIFLNDRQHTFTFL